MCGLAGFARHPNAPRLNDAVTVAEELLHGMVSRGHHATGIATVGGPQAFLFKWARPAGFVLPSAEWAEYRAKVTNDTTVFMGHTRFATQNNAHLDEAAHPFRIGQVTGAHNGIIRNWRDLARQYETGGGRDAWIVDSQAAFVLLDKFADPQEALRLLDGYWALTWTKGPSLFFTRADAPLAVAYVPAWQTLFWCSEMSKLKAALTRAGAAYEAWEAKPATLYEYDPRKFDADGAHGTKTELKLNRRDTRTDPRTSGRGRAVQAGLDDAYPWDEIPGGFSTRQQLAARGFGPADPPKGKRERRKERQAGRTVAERTEDMDTSAGVSLTGLARVCKRLADRLTECEVQVEALQQENAFLYEVANAAGLLDRVPPSVPVPEVCEACSRGEEAGVLLPAGAGYVHEACVLP